ncbi:MAG: HNH endonuclease [Nitrospinaceae bacterium]
MAHERRTRDKAGSPNDSVKREKERGRQLRQTTWWQNRLAAGVCHYCGGRFKPGDLTLDHVVPLARGGKSTRGNCVPCCKECNTLKKSETPVDLILSGKLKPGMKL